MPPIPFSFCDLCSRIIRPVDIEKWHQEVIAPLRRLEEERLEWALREGGG